MADYGPGDEPFVGLTERLAIVAPKAEVVLTPVRDSLAGGLCVARLALGDGPPHRLVIHDIAARVCGTACSHSPAVLAAATVRALARHPHAVCEPVPPHCIPRIPG